MFDFFRAWYRRYFTDPQATLLVILLVVALLIIYLMGSMLVPLFAAIVIAYLLEGSVQKLKKRNVPRLWAVNIVFMLFIAFIVFLLLGLNVLSVSVASIPAIITVLVYLILVPLLIFFFLKDKNLILVWLSRFLPAERRLVTEIWQEMDAQIGNYVRGKIYEIIIVGGVSFIVFQLMGLNYAPLLALLVGLS